LTDFFTYTTRRLHGEHISYLNKTNWPKNKLNDEAKQRKEFFFLEVGGPHLAEVGDAQQEAYRIQYVGLSYQA
jgi:hypothetical protein